MQGISLMQGNCLELMKQISDKSVDMVLCDLPYNMTRNDWDCAFPLNHLWLQYCRIVKDIVDSLGHSLRGYLTRGTVSNGK